MSDLKLKVGGLYNWIGQPERLVYMGYNWSGNGYWHQFRKTDGVTVWCEVKDSDLSRFEETKVNGAAAPAPAEAKEERTSRFGRVTITGPAEDVAFVVGHLPDVDDPQPQAAQPVPFGEIHQDLQGVRSLRTETAQKLYSVPAGTKLYTAAAPTLTEDTRILDWLELRFVTVREPLRYGSREVFTSYADADVEEPTKPSDLREKVRAALRSTQGGE